MTKWDLSQLCRAGSTIQKSINVIHFINRLKKKIHAIISIEAEEALEEIQLLFRIFETQ